MSQKSFDYRFTTFIIILSNICISELLRLPLVSLYKGDCDTRKETEKTYNESKITFLSEELQFICFQLECKHHKPIQWIMDNDLASSRKEVQSGFQTYRTVKDINDQETYEYKTIASIKIPKYQNQDPLVASCQTSNNHIERRVIVAQFYDITKTYSVQKVKTKEENNLTDILDFDRKYNASILRKSSLKKNESCPFKMTLFVSEHWDDRIIFKWSVPPNEQLLAYYTDLQSFENAFRFTPILEEECIKILPEIKNLSQDCSGCSGIPFEKHNYYPRSFFYSVQGHARVVKTFFDVYWNFYVNKQPFPTSSLVLVKITPKPTVVYKGQEIHVECYSSIVSFSIGTLIGWSIDSQGKHIHFSNSTVYKGLTKEAATLTSGLIKPTKRFLDQNNIQNLTVFCKSPVWNSSEWVTASKTITLTDSAVPKIIMKSEDRSVYDFTLGQDINLECEAQGTPLPKLEIIPPRQNLNFTVEIQNTTETSRKLILTIRNIDTEYEGKYRCKAESIVGEDDQTFQIKVSIGVNNFSRIALISAGVITLIFILIVSALTYKLRKEKEEFSRKTEEEAEKFDNGFKDDPTINFVPNSEHIAFEIPLSKWEIGGTILGSGAFGVVHKGWVQLRSGKTIVAIKTVHRPKDITEFGSSLMEITILSYIGRHDNIVSLVAIWTEHIRKRRILIGVEFCSNGDLLSYLKKRKALCNNFVQDGKISSQKVNSQSDENSSYTNLMDVAHFSTLDLYQWSHQIASGMEFLALKRVLHADLAARNVLLTEDRIAKISDFGLSRQLRESNNYTKKTNSPLPWRWMAIESLKFAQFSMESDIWAYGVTLFEIFSLGAEPWPGMSWNNEFITELEKGLRLSRPNYATQSMYFEVMLECWRMEPQERITFEKAKIFFEKAIQKLNSGDGQDDENFATC